MCRDDVLEYRKVSKRMGIKDPKRGDLYFSSKNRFCAKRRIAKLVEFIFCAYSLKNNGDELYSVTAVYVTEVKIDKTESMDIQFFSLENLPEGLTDEYRSYINFVKELVQKGAFLINGKLVQFTTEEDGMNNVSH
jgi:hypothetical protein